MQHINHDLQVAYTLIFELFLNGLDADLVSGLALLEADSCRYARPLAGHRAGHHVSHSCMRHPVTSYASSSDKEVVDFGWHQTAIRNL